MDPGSGASQGDKDGMLPRSDVQMKNHSERRERLYAIKGHTKGSLHSQWPCVAL